VGEHRPGEVGELGDLLGLMTIASFELIAFLLLLCNFAFELTNVF
jgi:hypothetical protein